jgi:hypothetical protein
MANWNLGVAPYSKLLSELQKDETPTSATWDSMETDYDTLSR